MKRITEDAIAKIRKQDEELLEKQFSEMASKYTGKGSALATKRIQNEYVGLMASQEFKDKINIDFHKDNLYVWKV